MPVNTVAAGEFFRCLYVDITIKANLTIRASRTVDKFDFIPANFVLPNSVAFLSDDWHEIIFIRLRS